MKECDDQKKIIEDLQDKNKESESKISFCLRRIKELEQHVKDLSEILDEWCTKVIVKRR